MCDGPPGSNQLCAGRVELQSWVSYKITSFDLFVRLNIAGLLHRKSLVSLIIGQNVHAYMDKTWRYVSP